MKAILLKDNGMTNRVIAAELGVSEESIRRWLKGFNPSKLDELMDKPRSGRKSALNAEQEEYISDSIRDNPRSLGYLIDQWTPELLMDHIFRSYNLRVSLSTAYRFLQDRQEVIYKSEIIDADAKSLKKIIKEFEENDSHEVWYIKRINLGRMPLKESPQHQKDTGKRQIIWEYKDLSLLCAIKIPPNKRDAGEMVVWAVLNVTPLKLRQFLANLIKTRLDCLIKLLVLVQWGRVENRMLKFEMDGEKSLKQAEILPINKKASLEIAHDVFWVMNELTVKMKAWFSTTKLYIDEIHTRPKEAAEKLFNDILANK